MERDENSFERQKDADESKSKDIHKISGQVGGDVCFGVLWTKKKGKKKVKYNRDKNATMRDVV